MRFLLTVIATLTFGASLATAPACARARAKTAPDMPPLDVPAAPPRDVEPVETEPPPPVPLPGEPARRAPVRPRPQPRAEPPRPEPPKPESKPEPPEPPRPAEEAPRPPSPLQTTPPGNETEIERGIRSTMSRAQGDLDRIDYRSLNVEARRQYDTAKNFVRQAERALQDRNLMFARDLADKAAALAAQLAPKK
jgi:outer membrane biosynthesis protein TonB